MLALWRSALSSRGIIVKMFIPTQKTHKIWDGRTEMGQKDRAHYGCPTIPTTLLSVMLYGTNTKLLEEITVTL